MVLVMFSGLGIWGFGQVPGLASGLAEVCRLSLTFIETVVQSVQQLPGSHCWGPGLPGGLAGVLICSCQRRVLLPANAVCAGITAWLRCYG